MSVAVAALSARLDELLAISDIRDYPGAVNGLQLAHRGPVKRIASAVDVSAAAIAAASAAGANLLLVHHGLFWGGLQPISGFRYERVRALVDGDIAVYAAHLPLDAHAEFGNSKLLADHLGLTVTAGFARHDEIHCGVRGDADVPTSELLARTDAFAREFGGRAISSAIPGGHRTRRWAICSGAGAGAATLDEAQSLGVDTLIVGEGPHWTAVDAPERGLVIMYAGHYATETLGVRALGAALAEEFGLPHEFVFAPSGL